MNRKSVLTKVVICLFMIGGLALLTPFFISMKPSAKAESNLARIDLSLIDNGRFFFASHPRYGSFNYSDFEWGFMFYKTHDGQVKVFDVPLKDGAVGLPDGHWWRPYWECKKFGPTTKLGVVDESKPIKCHDSSKGERKWYLEWEWDINGKNTKGGISDMLVTHGTIEGNYFVFGK